MENSGRSSSWPSTMSPKRLNPIQIANTTNPAAAIT
ncbi:hypothetical protein FHW23_001412 [Curtobacterium pusillum]|uniref:Uncharacterized protein n=1 Tax=Curtobacterium pusillum TaxID=69373 RepID=A0AAW3T5C9_9MICO|nr:hypothetical protein [Curtobacterium pusillum]